MHFPATAQQLVARAPTRIDFGGGWTDVPPYSLEEGGCVCNVAISLYSTVTLRPGSGTGTLTSGHASDAALARAALSRTGVSAVDATLTNAFPVSAGLGGSSAAGVAMLGALDRWSHPAEPLNRAALAEASRQLEVEDLGIAGGRQDHYAAALGGALGLWFGEHTTWRRLPLSDAFARELATRCIVAYTGQSRISADTITGVMSAYRENQRGVRAALARIKELAELMIVAVTEENLDALGALVGEHWVHQRALHPAIPTPQIDALLSAAEAAGAVGGKALGASGGGCVLAIAPKHGEERVRAAMRSSATLLDFVVDTDGFYWTTANVMEDG
ncbi:MAG: hypothetical protein U0163_12080 [Gemmatimonadaceae bacterium]